MSDTVTLRVQPFRSCEFIFMATILTYQCSNDNTVFLLDYLYYNVCEVGCRLFFDHYLFKCFLIYCVLCSNSYISVTFIPFSDASNSHSRNIGTPDANSCEGRKIPSTTGLILIEIKLLIFRIKSSSLSIIQSS